MTDLSPRMQEAPRQLPPEATGPERIPHETQLGLGRFAVEYIQRRDEYASVVDTAHAKLAELESLRPASHISRFRQRGALKDWLQKHEYTGYAHAIDALKHRASSSQLQHDLMQDTIDSELDHLRGVFAGFNEFERERADTLLRGNGLPDALVEACDASANPDEPNRNIIDWLSSKPDADDSKQATNEQLEGVLIWNAVHTERVAANSTLVAESIHDYNQATMQLVQDGALDAAFLEAPLLVKKVIIGDILDRTFLGYNEMSKGGEYVQEKQHLLLWPYEMPGENDLRGVVLHEINHAKGGFETTWINEAYTDRFRLMMEGRAPDEVNTTYGQDRSSIQELQDGAPDGMTDAAASSCYVGSNDWERNEHMLRSRYTKAYKGVDVLGIVDDGFKEMTSEFAGKRLPHESRKEALQAVLLSSIYIGRSSKKMFADPTLSDFMSQQFRVSATTASTEVDRIAYTSAARFCEAVSEVHRANELPNHTQ